MLQVETKEVLKVFWKKIGLLLLFILAAYLDGNHFAKFYSNGELILTILVLITFLVFYMRSSPRSKRLYLYMILATFFVEYLLSVWIEMYSYRSGGIPTYIPFAQSIFFVRIYEFSRKPLIINNKNFFISVFFLFTAIVSGYSLIAFNDVFGFVMSIAVYLLLVLRPKYKLFFLTWFFVIIFIEFGGVALGVWNWPNYAFKNISFLPSNNPPCGIALFYFTIEFTVFLIFILVNQKIWKRFKSIKSNTKIISNG